TIARLAARFYDPDDGEIFIGGVNIKEYKKDELMNKISFVFQNSRLFKMSIRENLLIGNPNATDEEIEDALVNSGSQEIIESLKYGIDTVYGTKGTYFSGGESQRLSIARAFLKNAQLLILDEATAFADPENEHIIQESFKRLSKNKTTLMIAHRLSTVIEADKILVVKGGKIVEEGNHSSLLDKNGVYKELWDEYQRSVNWKIGGKHE
ncbi:MAG: ATP-binding cassette domain-containing protein, partial [Peptostreptococcus porci]|nr:ATP-binding cassette domain-containing protein [Peptostreptococcus porci]